MRIEPPKTHNSDKSNQNVKNAENVFRPIPNNTQLNNPPAPSSGAFEKIMNEARKSAKDDAASSKAENNSDAGETSEPKKTGEKEIHGKENLKEREENKGGNRGGESGDENENPAMFASPGIFSNGKVSGETSIPAARSILHVADLERIVSTLRTIETKNSQQVLIALKNSVLEGLQIKITLDENGKLKAEFLASNEKIKEQLKARKNELSEIFKNRGVKFSELEIKTDRETDKTGAENEDLTKASENKV